MQQRLARLVGEIDGADGVTVVSTLADASAALSATQFALVLVDIGLPDGDGRELVSRVHRHNAELPVLVISSWGHEDIVLSALQAGACGYLLKERDDVELTVSLRSIQRGGAPIDPVIAR